MSEQTQGARVSVSSETGQARHGLTIHPHFTKPGVHPFDKLEWTKRRSAIVNEKGEVIFENTNVEVPKSWSQLATDILVSKYFRRAGVPGTGSETSAKQVVTRIAHSIRVYGEQEGYFATPDDAETFEMELTHLLITQKGAFNSPVWFNCGLSQAYGIQGSPGNWRVNETTGEVEEIDDSYAHPQNSACFIQSVNDDLMSIFELVKNEARLFKYGSGTGTNFSALRGSMEKLSSGGTSSGLMSFLDVLDKGAGATKSGGTTRRAAKMVILDMDHPEIEEFITWKAKEERKVAALIQAGYPSDFNGDAYKTVSGQNSNNSVRVTDAFMDAYLRDGDWTTYLRTTGEPYKTYKARDLMRLIAESAWKCADPGIQFDTTINDWHTCANTDRIYASNPCVTGDTLIATADGCRRIAELVGRRVTVVNGVGLPSEALDVFPTGRKAVFELRTESGYRLNLTADHKVLTANRGDVPASELTRDDEVVLQRPGFGSAVLPTSLGETFGAFVGGGYPAGVGESLVLAAPASTGTETAIADASYDAFGAYVHADAAPERTRFRDAIFALDKTSQAAVLRGLFTAAGSVSDAHVVLECGSVELLEQTQLLLLGFGVKARLSAGEGLRLSDSSRVAFEREIGFRTGSPQAKALAALNRNVSASRERFTDAVAHLTFLGEADVYDLTEPTTHHFVANGIVVHNCSEYMFLNDSACNLASLNLVKFLREDGSFDVDAYRAAIRTFTIAQEILVGFSSYPTKKIAENSYLYRPLGLGYANLGTLLMLKGVPYESEDAFAICGALTAIMGGHAYATSAEIAAVKSPFGGFAKNREPMMRVMAKHRAAVYRINPDRVDPELLKAAQDDWDAAIRLGETYGYRNAQATVLAPTGTIGLLMDCDTTGIEPDYALVKFKKLAGGGYFKIINQSVPQALKRLGYSDAQIGDIVTYVVGTGTLAGVPFVNTVTLEEKGLKPVEIARIEKALAGAMDLDGAVNVWTVGHDALKRLGFTDEQIASPKFHLLRSMGFTSAQIEEATKVICGTQTVEGAPHLAPEHVAVFDCANKCGPYGERFISPMGHVRMMAAAQPFLSGAISKTVNLPNEATVEEVERIYVEAWRLRLKAIALYRDGSKLSQPLSARGTAVEEEGVPKTPQITRRRLPDERSAITHKFSVGGHEGYVTVGMYDDGTPGEVFLTMSKEGSTISGLMDVIATMTSMALQYGVPLDALVRKFSHMRFEPQGFTNNPKIPMAKSIIDYIFRWLGLKFLDDPGIAGTAASFYDENGNGKNGHGSHEALPNGHAPEPKAIATPDDVTPTTALEQEEHRVADSLSDAPACHVCGSLMRRAGSCYVCSNCGANTGCS
jgi:ribonucleoside-diphosphate reductase alpha chain